eukprot:PLAT12348.2.p1 GENE.PLAT12348.2~~PLAT12348.2.p1  ORF type:complete len:685 (-),score=357.23 PLAT12348.2:57-2111(-)
MSSYGRGDGDDGEWDAATEGMAPPKKRAAADGRKRAADDGGDESVPAKKRKLGEDTAAPVKKRFLSEEKDGVDDEAYLDDEEGEDEFDGADGLEHGEIDEDDEDDGYGSDMIGDEDDRAMLDSLPEMQREMILAERYEQRRKKRERAALKRTLRQSKRSTRSEESKRQESAMAKLKRARAKAAGRSRLRDGGDDDDDDDDDAYSASRDDGMAFAHIEAAESSSDEDEYRPASERRRRKKSSRSSRSDAYGDSDEDDDDDDDAAGGRHGRRGRGETGEDEWREEDEPDETYIRCSLDELNLIRQPRAFLEKHVDEPYFERAVTGSFVRLSIGYNTEKDQAVFRCCEVIGVRPYPRSYKLGSQHVRIGLLLRHGKAERVWRMNRVSNHRIQTSEFRQWLAAMNKAEQRPLSSRAAANRRQRMLQAVKGHSYTAEEISALIAKRVERNKTRTYALRKADLERRLAGAKEAGDVAAAEELSAKLEELLAEDREHMMRRDSKVFTLQDINKRNREKNFKSEMFISRELSREEAEAQNDGKVAESNPFLKRRTVPKNLWIVPGTKKDVPPSPTSAKKAAEEAAAAKQLAEEEARRRAEEEEEKKREEAAALRDKQTPLQLFTTAHSFALGAAGDEEALDDADLENIARAEARIAAEEAAAVADAAAAMPAADDEKRLTVAAYLARARAMM